MGAPLRTPDSRRCQVNGHCGMPCATAISGAMIAGRTDLNEAKSLGPDPVLQIVAVSDEAGAGELPHVRPL